VSSYSNAIMNGLMNDYLETTHDVTVSERLALEKGETGVAISVLR